MLNRFIQKNVQLSRRFDAFLFSSMSVDGNRAFVEMVKTRIGNSARIIDIGGGKTPIFSAAEVARAGLVVVGVDIDENELAAAPVGCYEATIVADITEYRGLPNADAVVVQSLLEHVRDGGRAAQGIASFAKAQSEIFTFCPNRRAWFARLNLMLPEGVKKWMLHTIFPATVGTQGFPAFYDRCTPAEMSQALEGAGIEVLEIHPFFVSTYFMFLFPLHFLWRVFNWPFMKILPLVYCETFIIVGKKHPG